MCRTVIAAVLALAASVVALELPDTPGAISSGPRVAGQSDRDHVRPETQGTLTTAYSMLEQMSPAERKNACISVEFESSDAELLALGREVERLWNGGQCDEALVQLANLEAHVGPVAIGNSWRTPVPTLETNLWETDVRIGNQDTLMELAFDQQLSSGHLFVVFRHGIRSAWYLNMSSDGGATWSETYSWSGLGVVPSVDVAVLANHVYVVYSDPADNATQVRLRRFYCTNGAADTFSTGDDWVTPCTLAAGDTVNELSLVSNQHSSNNRLYITTLVTDGSVLYSWDDTDPVSWTKVTTGITSGAYGGLDATENEGFDSTYLFFSYIDTNDSLRIYGRTTSFRRRYSRYIGSGTPTSISAYRDTIICAFEQATSTPHQVFYMINYGDVASWSYGTLSETDTIAEAPGVTARGGGGLAAVYRHYTPTRQLRFLQRVYHGPGVWSDPVSIANHEPYYNRPAIEYLGSSVFGVAYLSWTSPLVRAAYFDRSDWPIGVAEQRRLIVDDNILSITPNPLSGHGRLNYTLNRPADLRVQVYDRAGRVVRTVFAGHGAVGRQSIDFDAAGMAPGVYFVRADADGMTLTVPVTVVK